MATGRTCNWGGTAPQEGQRPHHTCNWGGVAPQEGQRLFFSTHLGNWGGTAPQEQRVRQGCVWAVCYSYPTPGGDVCGRCLPIGGRGSKGALDLELQKRRETREAVLSCEPRGPHRRALAARSSKEASGATASFSISTPLRVTARGHDARRVWKGRHPTTRWGERTGGVVQDW